MLELFEQGNDVVLASVYAPGGKIIGVAGWRLLASKSVSNTFRYLGGLREMHTLSSLYRVYRAGTLRRAADTYGYLLVREPGFAANVELLLKLYNAGATVAEVPTVNDWSTRKGESKMQLKPTVLAYLRVMAAHLVGRIQPPPVSPLGEAQAAAVAAGDGDPGGKTESRRRPRAARPNGMSARPTRVGVVGGGVLGTSLALRLAQAGADVTVIERGPGLGGLAGTMDFGGHEVDRFYHVITPADASMIAMAEEVGLGEDLRFTPVGAGFFADGEMHDFNGIGDLLRFSPLSPPARLRLGWFVAQCQLRSSYEALEQVPLETWLRRHCGRQVFERIWKPLLESRFDGDFSGLPATYLWARTRGCRARGRAKGGGQEEMGHVVGGHQRLIDAMVSRAEGLGVKAITQRPRQRPDDRG